MFRPSRPLFSLFLLSLLCSVGVGVWGQSQFPSGATNWVGTSGDLNNGDRDGTVVLFFEIPDNTAGNIYFGINYPGNEAIAGNFDTQTGLGNSYWYLIGGNGALSDSSSQLTTYSPYPSTQPLTGTILSTAIYGTQNLPWQYFPSVSPNQGEHIGNKYYFKIVLQVATGMTGKNTFQADVSSVGTNGVAPTAVAGAKSFAFDWPVILSSTAATRTFDFYPFVPSGATGSLTTHNWDLDNQTPVLTLTDNNSNSYGPVSTGAGSSDGSSSFTIGSNTNGTWHLNAAGVTGGTASDLTEFWFVNGSTVLRTYSSAVAAQSADHVTLTYNGSSVPVNGSGQATLQIVDSSGNPQLISKKVYLSFTGGSAQIASASNTSTSLPAAAALVVTDNNGLATVNITDSIAETVTLQSTTNGGANGSDSLAGANNTVNIIFSGSTPTLTSASSSNFVTNGNQNLPTLTINNNNGAFLTFTNNIYVRIPSVLSSSFNTAQTPSISGTASGRVSSASFTNSSTLKLSLSSNLINGETIIIGATTALQLAVSTNVSSSGSLQLSYDGGGSYPINDSLANAITINTVGTSTWSTTAATSVWATAGNWASGGVPVTGSAVVIPTGITGSNPAIPATTAIGALSSISIGSGSTLTLNNNPLTVTGATIIDGALVATTGNLSFGGDVSGTGTLTASSATTSIGGNLSIATFNANGGTVVFNSAAAQTTKGYTFVNLQKSGGSTLSVASSALTVSGTLTIDPAKPNTVDLGSQNFTIATLSNTGSSGVFALDGSQTQSITTMANASGTVRYKGAAGGTVGLNNFYNLDINQSGQTFTLSTTNKVVNGSLSVTAGILDLSTFGLSVTSTVTNMGTIKLAGTQTLTLSSGNDSAHGIWNYYGTAAAAVNNFSGTADYFNLTITGSGPYSLPATLKIAGSFSNSGTFSATGNTMTMSGTGTINTGGIALNNLTIGNSAAATLSSNIAVQNLIINTGASLDASSSDITVNGDWTNTPGAGGFNAQTRTVTFSNTTTQTHNITGDTTFYNLTSSTTVAANLIFASGSTTTSKNILNLTGSSASTRLTLKGSAAATWTLDNQGAPGNNILNWLDVQYSALLTNSLTPANSVGANNPAGPPKWNVSTTYTWSTTATTQNWLTPANWSPVGVPGNGDVVIIGNNSNSKWPILDAGVTSLDSLTIGAGDSLSLGGNSLTVVTTLTKDPAATIQLYGNETVSPTALISTGITDYNAPSGSYSIKDNGVVDYANLIISGNADFTDAGAIQTPNLTISASKTAGSVSFSNNLTVTTGMIVNSGAYSVSITGATNTIAGTTVFNNNGTLTLGGSSIFTGGITATSPGPATIFINGSVITAGGGIDLHNAADIRVGASLSLDSANGQAGAAGPINLAGSNISASAASVNLTLTSLGSTTANGSTVTMGAAGNRGGAGSYLNSLTIVAGGAITGTSAINVTGGSINATTRVDSSAPISLSGANVAANVSLNTLNFAGGSSVPGAITYVGTGGYSITGIQTGSTIDLTNNTAGSVTQTGDITCSGLVTRGSGASWVLSRLTNTIPSFASNVTTASLQISTSGTLSIDTVVGVTGINPTTPNLVTLIAGDAISQTQAIKASTLHAETRKAGGASITLNQSNTCPTINFAALNAAGSAAQNASISYTDSGTGSLTVGNDFSGNTLGIWTLGTVTLSVAGDIKDTVGTGVVANILTLGTKNGVLLSGANNAVSSLGITNSTSGAVSFTNNTATTLTVTGISNNGASAGNIAVSSAGNISVTGAIVPLSTKGITISATGTLTTSAAIGVPTVGNTGTVTLIADDMVIGAAVQSKSGNITLKPSTATRAISLGNGLTAGTLGLSQADLLNVTTSGMLTIGDPLDSGNIVADGNLDLSGGALNGPLFIQNTANTTGGISLNYTVTTPSLKDLYLESGSTVGGTGLITVGFGAPVNNAALSVKAGGNIGLTTVAATLAATTSAGTITINNTRATGLTINTVNSVIGVSTTTGAGTDISLTEISGAMTISSAIGTPSGAGGSARVTLSSAGTMTQTAAITTRDLLLLGLGTKTLTANTNDISNLAADLTSGTNGLSYKDANAYSISTIGTTNGIQTAGGSVTLSSNAVGPINLNVATGTDYVVNTGNGAAAGGAITFQKPAGLSVNSKLNSNGTTNGGDITFGTIAGSSKDLELVAGNGNVIIPSAISGLRTFLITSAKNVSGDATATTVAGAITGTTNFTQTAGSGKTWLGTLTLSGIASITGSAVVLAGTVTAPGGFSSSGTTFDNTGGPITTTDTALSVLHSGAVTIGAQLSSGTGALKVDSSGSTVAINANIAVSTGTVNIDSVSTGTTANASGTITASGAATIYIGKNRTGVFNTSANINTQGGTVTFYQAVKLNAGIVVNSTNGLAAGADIDFKSTIDNAQSLGLTAGTSGSVIFRGAVGTTRLGAITINSANNVDGDGVAGTDAANIRAASFTQIAGNGTTRVGSVDLTGAASLTGVNIVAVNGVVTATTGFISTGSGPFANGSGATISTTNATLSINHAGTVTINGNLSSGAGNLNVQSSGSTVGIGATLQSTTGGINVDASGTTTISSAGAVAGSGAAQIYFGSIGAGTLNLAAPVNSAGGVIKFWKAVTLSAPLLSPLVVSSGTTGGSITFTGALDGAQNLALTSGGPVLFSSTVGTPTALGTGTGAAININQSTTTTFSGQVKTNSGITQAGIGGTAVFNGNVTVSPAGDTATTFNSSVTLGGITFQSDGPITFGDATADSLTLAGTSAINTTSGNSAITINATITGAFGFAVTTNGSGLLTVKGSSTAVPAQRPQQITLNSASLVFGNSVALATGGGGTGNITFQVDQLNWGTADTILAAGGSGGSSNIFNITTRAFGTVIQFADAKSTTGPFTSGDAWISPAFSNVTAAGGFVLGSTLHTGTIYLGNDMSGATLPGTLNATLTVQEANAGAGYIDVRNQVQSATSASVSLDNQTPGKGVQFNQTPSSAFSLGAGSFSTVGTTKVDLATDTTITANGGITFSGTGAVDSSGNKALTLNSTGTTALNAPIGATNALSTISVAFGTSSIGANVTTTGAQTYTGAVTLGNGVTFNSGGVGNLVWFKSTVGGGGTAQTLAVTAADARFDGTVGGAGNSLTSVSVAGTTFVNATNITTTGIQTYNGNVTLGNGVTFASGGVGNLVWFKGTVGGGGTAQTLAVTAADARFDGIVGGAGNSVTSVSVAGATLINSSNITTTLIQTYTGAVTLGNGVTFTGGLLNLVWFKSTVDGTGAPRSLTITTANAEFDNTVGAGSLTSSVSVAGTSLIKANITTTGAQTYTGPVTLGADVVFTGGAGSLVQFGNTVDSQGGPRSFTVSGVGATGQVTVTGAMGAGASLNAVTITGGAVNINNLGILAAAGAASVTLNASGVSPSLTLSGTVYKTTAAQSWTATNGIRLAGGAVDTQTYFVSGGLGGTIAFAGTIDLNQRYITVDSTSGGGYAAGSNITFVNAINGSDGSETITTSAGTGGTVQFQSTIGLTTGVKQLTVIGAFLTRLGGNVRTFDTPGNLVSISSPVQLDADITINTANATNNGNVNIAGALSSATAGTYGLIVTSGSATVSLGVVGSVATKEPKWLQVTAATINLNGNVRIFDGASGQVALTGAVLLNADAIIDQSGYTSSCPVSITGPGTVNSVGSARNLTIGSAGSTSNISVSGVIGGSLALSALTIEGKTIAINSVGTAAAVGAASITVNGNSTATLSLTGTDYRSTGPQNWNIGAGNAFSLNGGGAGSTTNLVTATANTGTIVVNGTLSQNGRALLIDSTNGLAVPVGSTITVNAAVEGTGGAQTLTIRAADPANAAAAGSVILSSSGDLGGTSAIGPLSVSGSSIQLNGPAYHTSNAAQSYSARLGIILNPPASSTLDPGTSSITFNPGATSGIFVDQVSGAGTIQIKGLSNVVNGSFYGYRGALNLSSSGLTVNGDVALFGLAYSADDPDRAGSVTEFQYPAFAAMTNVGAGGRAFPVPSGAFAATGLNALTLTVNGNFYANGIDLNGAAVWSLRLPNNDSVTGLVANGFGDGTATGRYARVFKSTIKNVSVQNNVGATTSAVWLSAAESCTDATGNSNVAFLASRPTIASARTIYDDMVEVTFSQPIENSNGELQSVVGQVTASNNLCFNNGVDGFTGIYVWNNGGAATPWTWAPGQAGAWLELAANLPAYKALSVNVAFSATESALVAAGDIPTSVPLYFRTSSGATTTRPGGAKTWNTDASLVSSGTLQSTDRSGVQQTRYVTLAIRKARLFSALGKVMMANTGFDTSGTTYEGANGGSGGYADGVAGHTYLSAFQTTTDSCRPALVGAWTGQATYDPTNTRLYNGHNFLHLRYSEPMDFSNSNLDGSSTSDGSTLGISLGTYSTGAVTMRSSAGMGSFSQNGSNVEIAGLGLSYTGKFTSGARALTPDPALTGDADKINLIYRNTGPGTEDPDVNGVGLTIFLAGYSVNIGGKLYWPGYLGDGTAGNQITDVVGVKLRQTDNLTFGKDASNNLIEPDTSSYPGLASAGGLVVSSNATTPSNLLNIPANGGGFTNTSLFANGWNVGAPAIGTLSGGGGLSRIYTEFNGSGEVTDFDFVMDKPVRDTSWSYQDELSSAINYTDNEKMGFKFGDVKDLSHSYSDANTQIDTQNNHVDLTDPNADAVSHKVTNSTADDVYFRVLVNPVIHDWTTITSNFLDYNAKDPNGGFVTDLAGNLMLTTTTHLLAVDRTPPNIQYSLGAVGGNRIYVYFDKPVFQSGASANVQTTPLAPADFLIYDAGGNPYVPTGVQVVNTEQIPGTQAIGARSVFLDLPSNLVPIKPDYLLGYSLGAALSGTTGSNIADKFGNEIQYANRYRFSNVGIGLVDPILATDDIINPAFAGSIKPVTVFNGTSSLTGQGIISLQVDKDKNLNSANKDDTVRLFYDIGVSAALRAFGPDSFWYPHTIPGLIGQADVKARLITGATGAIGSGLTTFSIPGDDLKATNGAELEFVLEMNGLPVAWAQDVNDPRTIRPWSVKLNSVVTQRGNVTILNNVINPVAGDKTVLQYQVTQPGNVTVMVLTIDGNVVKLLQNGQQGVAERYTLTWDGKNQNGQVVARGLYLIRAVGPGFDEIRKVLVVKP